MNAMNALVQSGKLLLKELGQKEIFGIGIVGGLTGLMIAKNFWYNEGSSRDVNNPFIPDIIEGYVDNATDVIVEGYEEIKTDISSEVTDIE